MRRRRARPSTRHSGRPEVLGYNRPPTGGRCGSTLEGVFRVSRGAPSQPVSESAGRAGRQASGGASRSDRDAAAYPRCRAVFIEVLEGRDSRRKGNAALAALLLLVPAAASAALRPPGTPAQANLVPAKFTTITDRMGFNWDVNPMGVVNDGSNDCFDGGMALMVDGRQFRPRSPMMTADGREFVLSGKVSNIAVTRRVLIDKQRAAVRYLEILRNEGSGQAKVAATVRTMLGGSCREIVTSSGEVFGGALGGKDAGVVTIGAGNRPSVMFLVADPRAKARPTVTVQNNRTVQVAWSLTLGAGRTAAIFHVVAQRKGITRQNAPALFRDFFRRGLVRPDVPKGLMQTIVNFRRGAGGFGASARLEGLDAVARLAEEYGVDRGGSDTLVLGEDALLTGTARSDGLTVETRHGRTRVRLSETALIAGGGGRGRPERVFLRDGEILAGTVLAEAPPAGGGFSFESAGVTVELSPGRLELLFTRADPADGTPPEGALAYIVTSLGERLAVMGGLRRAQSSRAPARGGNAPRRGEAGGGGTGLVLEAATAWGRLRLPFDEVVSVSRRPLGEDGQPIHTLVMTNGSRLSVILTGGELAVRTARFDRVSIRPNAVAGLLRVKGAKGPIAGLDGLGLPEEVRKRLEGEVSLDFEDATLSYALDILSRVGKVPVRLDLGSEELNDGAGRRKVTFKVTNMELIEALNSLLEPHGLVARATGAAGPDSGALVVTQAPDAEGDAADVVNLPTWTLTGDNLVVGDLDLEQLEIVTSAGTTTVSPRDIRAIERAEVASEGRLAGGAGREFTFTLMNDRDEGGGAADGGGPSRGGDPPAAGAAGRDGELVGRPGQAVLPIRCGRHLLRVPLRHVVSFRRPVPPGKETGSAGGDGPF